MTGIGGKDAISVDRIAVSPGRMRVFVTVAEGTPLMTDEVIAQEASMRFPTLKIHSCINTKGPSFGDVMANTSLPHLLEHLIIAEQVNAATVRGRGLQTEEANASFVGTTEWIDGPSSRKALVEVSFFDDMEAIKALNRALAFLNSLFR